MAAGRVWLLRAVAAGMVMGGSLFLLVMGFWPHGNRSRVLFFPAETLSPGQVEPLPVLRSARTLRLEWSPVIRMEDSGLIRLSFEPGSDAESPTGAGPGVRGFNSTSNPSLGDSHSEPLLVEARLDMAGVGADPPGIASEPMTLDHGVSFAWTVHPPGPGKYQGIVWLYLRSVPFAGGAGSERALAALPIEIQVVSVLGFGAGPVRILGVAGTLAGLILGLPNLRMVLQGLSPRPRDPFLRHDENNIK